MLDWLAQPIDPGRVHDVGFAVSWHARSMTLAWAFLAPVAVLVARFLKVLPWQDWPRKLDTQLWWRCHWIGQSTVLLLTIFGLGLIVPFAEVRGWHGWLGYSLVVLTFLQITLGVFRGTKGGPTAPAADGSPRGDHYDMTPWRVMFERVHKTGGYLLLALAAVTVILGLWQANAPRWMWLAVLVWWLVLAAAALRLQQRGWAVDTYHAIWGPGPEHPGNRQQVDGRSAVLKGRKDDARSG